MKKRIHLTFVFSSVQGTLSPSTTIMIEAIPIYRNDNRGPEVAPLWILLMVLHRNIAGNITGTDRRFMVCTELVFCDFSAVFFQRKDNLINWKRKIAEIIENENIEFNNTIRDF